jgi:hypothetical protein
MTVHGNPPAQISISELAAQFNRNSSSGPFSMTAPYGDLLLHTNSRPRAMSQYYGARLSIHISGSSYTITDAFPLNSGDAVEVDVNTTGGWCNADAQSHVMVLVYGAASSGSWDGQCGRKNDYYNFYFDGATVSISGHYGGASTNFGWVSYSLRQITYVGPGQSPTYYSLHESEGSYLGSARYNS